MYDPIYNRHSVKYLLNEFIVGFPIHSLLNNIINKFSKLYRICRNSVRPFLVLTLANTKGLIMENSFRGFH